MNRVSTFLIYHDCADFSSTFPGFAALAGKVADPALREKVWPPAPIPGLPDDVPVLDALRKMQDRTGENPTQYMRRVVLEKLKEDGYL